MAEKDKKEDTIELTEIATQTAPAYKLPDGNVVQAEELLLWIAQQVWEIKKSVA